MTRLVVSLTTIPPRLPFIEPTLIDLLEQTADISEIRVNIPLEYRRFPNAEIDIPKLPRGITVRRVAEDFGPATKLLPTLQDYRDDDVEVIVCDDDQSYAPDWAQKFVDGRLRMVVCASPMPVWFKKDTISTVAGLACGTFPPIAARRARRSVAKV